MSVDLYFEYVFVSFQTTTWRPFNNYIINYGIIEGTEFFPGITG